jgi:two-component system cell cycle sensor histidine kinase/response regulator CckA
MMAALQAAMPESRDREEFLQSMLEDSPMGLVLLGKDGKVIDANAAYAILLGYSREELAGKTLAELTHPADSARDAELIGEMVTGHRASYSVEKRLVRKNGEIRWVSVTAARLPAQGADWGFGLGMVQDVTDRKTSEVAREHLLQRYRASQEHLELAISAGGLGGWDWDIASNTVVYSPELRDIVKMTPDMAPGTLEDLLQLVHPDDRRTLSDAITLAIKDPDNDRFDVQVRLWCGDQTYRSLAGKGRIVRDDALRAVRMIGMAMDVTSQRAIQEQMNNTRRTEAISHLASGVAHDFNNLLMIMSGSAGVLKSMVAPGSEADELIAQIEDAAAHAMGITRQLTAVGRRSTSRPEVIDLNDLLSRFERVLKCLAGDRVALKMMLGRFARLVSADPAQVEQLTMNLVLNARDAMPDGGVVMLETDRAVLDDRTGSEWGVMPGEYVVIRVSDTGSGMDAETIKRMFEPYFTTNERYDGLGLSVAQGIVKQHGGHIGVASRRGQGTTVTVYLPAVPTPPLTADSPVGFQID